MLRLKNMVQLFVVLFKGLFNRTHTLERQMVIKPCVFFHRLFILCRTTAVGSVPNPQPRPDPSPNYSRPVLPPATCCCCCRYRVSKQTKGRWTTKRTRGEHCLAEKAGLASPQWKTSDTTSTGSQDLPKWPKCKAPTTGTSNDCGDDCIRSA